MADVSIATQLGTGHQSHILTHPNIQASLSQPRNRSLPSTPNYFQTHPTINITTASGLIELELPKHVESYSSIISTDDQIPTLSPLSSMYATSASGGISCSSDRSISIAQSHHEREHEQEKEREGENEEDQDMDMSNSSPPSDRNTGGNEVMRSGIDGNNSQTPILNKLRLSNSTSNDMKQLPARPPHLRSPTAPFPRTHSYDDSDLQNAHVISRLHHSTAPSSTYTSSSTGTTAGTGTVTVTGAAPHIIDYHAILSTPPLDLVTSGRRQSSDRFSLASHYFQKAAQHELLQQLQSNAEDERQFSVSSFIARINSNNPNNAANNMQGKILSFTTPLQSRRLSSQYQQSTQPFSGNLPQGNTLSLQSPLQSHLRLATQGQPLQATTPQQPYTPQQYRAFLRPINVALGTMQSFSDPNTPLVPMQRQAPNDGTPSHLFPSLLPLPVTLNAPPSLPTSAADSTGLPPIDTLVSPPMAKRELMHNAASAKMAVDITPPSSSAHSTSDSSSHSTAMTHPQSQRHSHGHGHAHTTSAIVHSRSGSTLPMPPAPSSSPLHAATAAILQAQQAHSNARNLKNAANSIGNTSSSSSSSMLHDVSSGSTSSSFKATDALNRLASVSSDTFNELSHTSMKVEEGANNNSHASNSTNANLSTHLSSTYVQGNSPIALNEIINYQVPRVDSSVSSALSLSMASARHGNIMNPSAHDPSIALHLSTLDNAGESNGKAAKGGSKGDRSASNGGSSVDNRYSLLDDFVCTWCGKSGVIGTAKLSRREKVDVIKRTARPRWAEHDGKKIRVCNSCGIYYGRNKCLPALEGKDGAAAKAKHSNALAEQLAGEAKSQAQPQPQHQHHQPQQLQQPHSDKHESPTTSPKRRSSTSGNTSRTLRSSSQHQQPQRQNNADAAPHLNQPSQQVTMAQSINTGDERSMSQKRQKRRIGDAYQYATDAHPSPNGNSSSALNETGQQALQLTASRPAPGNANQMAAQIYDMNFIAQQQQQHHDTSHHFDFNPTTPIQSHHVPTQLTTTATAGLLMNHPHCHAATSPQYANPFTSPQNFMIPPNHTLQLSLPHPHGSIPAQFTQQYGLLHPIQPSFPPTIQHPSLGAHHQSIATTNTSGQSTDAQSNSPDAASSSIGNGLHTALHNSMYNVQAQSQSQGTIMQGSPTQLPYHYGLRHNINIPPPSPQSSYQAQTQAQTQMSGAATLATNASSNSSGGNDNSTNAFPASSSPSTTTSPTTSAPTLNTAESGASTASASNRQHQGDSVAIMGTTPVPQPHSLSPLSAPTIDLANLSVQSQIQHHPSTTVATTQGNNNAVTVATTAPTTTAALSSALSSSLNNSNDGSKLHSPSKSHMHSTPHSQGHVDVESRNSSGATANLTVDLPTPSEAELDSFASVLKETLSNKDALLAVYKCGCLSDVLQKVRSTNNLLSPSSVCNANASANANANETTAIRTGAGAGAWGFPRRISSNVSLTPLAGGSNILPTQTMSNTLMLPSALIPTTSSPKRRFTLTNALSSSIMNNHNHGHTQQGPAHISIDLSSSSLHANNPSLPIVSPTPARAPPAMVNVTGRSNSMNNYNYNSISASSANHHQHNNNINLFTMMDNSPRDGNGNVDSYMNVQQ